MAGRTQTSNILHEMRIYIMEEIDQEIVKLVFSVASTPFRVLGRKRTRTSSSGGQNSSRTSRKNGSENDTEDDDQDGDEEEKSLKSCENRACTYLKVKISHAQELSPEAFL